MSSTSLQVTSSDARQAAPLFIPAQASTDVPLPHITWHDDWRELLERFSYASRTMLAPERSHYDRLPLRLRWRVLAWRLRHHMQECRHLLTTTWNLPVDAISDETLRNDMLELAGALYDYELPTGEAAIMTDLFDGLAPDAALPLIAWLRGAIVHISGSNAAAIAAPTGMAGQSIDLTEGVNVGPFELHSDMWIPALLMNMFGRGVVPGQGLTTLLSMSELWDIAASCGMPPDVIEQTQFAITEAGECDYYGHFHKFLYDSHPWSGNLKQALMDAAMTFQVDPGQGYIVNDRRWLHGRTSLDPRDMDPRYREERLLRLAYNNRRISTSETLRRLQWREEGRTASACKI